MSSSEVVESVVTRIYNKRTELLLLFLNLVDWYILIELRLLLSPDNELLSILPLLLLFTIELKPKLLMLVVGVAKADGGRDNRRSFSASERKGRLCSSCKKYMWFCFIFSSFIYTKYEKQY